MDRHLEQYTVADFIDFRNAGRLNLNPLFQRRSVWKPAARVYLIDSLLRDVPVPKMYFRTIIDPTTQSTRREVVDGQQRLRAIFDFADDNLRLTKRAGNYAGLVYSELDEDVQQAFLGYTIAAEQLINASDSNVLEVFARINTYSVSLVPAELRHAEYQSDFKWEVYEAAQRWKRLWNDYGIVSVSQRARMGDDELMAQLFLLCSEGLIGGEARTLNRAYKHFESNGFPELDAIVHIVDETLKQILDHIDHALVGPLASGPHFLMLFAAAAHALFGLRQAPHESFGGVDPGERPPAPQTATDWENVQSNLQDIAALIAQDAAPPSGPAENFWTASRRATINLRSRETRWPRYKQAFAV